MPTTPRTKRARCGRTHNFQGVAYPPCELRAGHWRAYCRTADGRHFLGVDTTPTRQPEEPT
jgi:hypothetical protein